MMSDSWPCAQNIVQLMATNPEDTLFIYLFIITVKTSQAKTIHREEIHLYFNAPWNIPTNEPLAVNTSQSFTHLAMPF